MEWVNGQLVDKRYDGPTQTTGNTAMSQVPVKWVHKETPSQFYTERPIPSGLGTIEEQFIPVVPLSALRDELESIVGQAHGGAMLGGDDAYQSCLVIETKAQRLLASLGE